ncbi:hypothetical protein ABB37_09231 [Leptomonas pyrrhocoris]|uniref:200 kDa antigen p200 n=1 Tax=Leptomonas pyrrhocoris TaxID=157538 RepID=A0A0M9FRJ9_LEPPY|nr:hypothetical protein ABB37_09231 [Leptomonas pyrrhocoris]XP_015653049.1 hypothetical protein ABB37_09231 [Leptomonas pyrrhocoris]KPA74609.1 hypothetical protein ABB37_09231 [Leptomonas pyrrhocoris]KPA74610.1 hypothetical protein ABB37_09231 [Leptomonas pyrrhocoris]|eukprot:XP_015653048.1 hypothetical protein ABB37_09231 [Leptomonas pyrrhocoris]
MSLVGVAIGQVGATETPDLSRADYPANRSRRGSISSSRFSSRLSRCSSVRDEVQSLDEFLRKQRVIRYMQEERERGNRSKLLREEHDAWVEFRDQERTERLKYMTEQEIVELLQREADEVSREKKTTEQSHLRASEDAQRRRQSVIEMRRQQEDTVLARRKSEVQADEARRAAERESAAKEEAVAEAERVQLASKELRDCKEELTAKCKQLEGELAEAKAATTQAQRSQKRAEENLAKEQAKAEKMRATKAANQQTNDKLAKELEEVRMQHAAVEAEKKKGDVAMAQALRDVARKEKELEDLKRHNEELLAVQEAQKAATEAKLRAAPSRDELSALKEALAKEKAARSEAESEAAQVRAQVEALQQQVAAANTPDPQQETENARKMKAVADDARNAQVELRKERQARERAEADAAEAKVALAQEQAARERAEKEAQRALAVPVQTPAPAKKAEADRKKLAEAERKLEEMRGAKARDEEELNAVKSALVKAHEDLEKEAAARSQFEQLASQAVAAEDRVPKEELYETRKKLLKAQKERDAARKDATSAQQNSERELGALKAWCERLQEQLRQQQQQQAIQTDDEFTPRTSTPTPHSRTPRAVRKLPPKDFATAQRQDEEKAANEQRIRELEAQVAGLQDDLKESQEQEEKALAVAASAIKAAQAPTPMTHPSSSNASPSRAQRGAPTKEQRARGKAAKDKGDTAEKENAEVRSKYDDLLKLQKQSDAALKSAEKQVEEQHKRIAQLEAELQEKAARSPSPRQAVLETHQTEPIAVAAASASDTSALEERIKELERSLKDERAARVAAEKQIEELKKRAAAAEAEAKKAKEAVVKAEEKYGASGAGAESKPKKAKSSCC